MEVLKLTISREGASNRKIINGRYEVLHTVGVGQFGKVLLAEDQLHRSQYVAIKTINRVDKMKLITQTYLSHTTKILREIEIMKTCNHPNVVKLFQVIDDLKYDKILLVMEFCQLGEIDWKKYNHYHEKYFKPPSKQILLNKILRDVVSGLEYLHEFKHIIHRDLKPSNLLIAADRTIKISDFGVSLILENNANDEKELGKTMGTPAFFAPELCQFVNNRLSSFSASDLKRSKVDCRIDLWSLGVVLYCLIFHQLPFEGFNEFDLFIKIASTPLAFPKTKDSINVKDRDKEELTLLKELILKLLLKDANKRPTIKEIKSHPFTLFDLNAEQALRFQDQNRQIFARQTESVTSKMRNFFRAPASPKPKPRRVSEVKISELEKVDDLLDSYLDDSSSLGSVEDFSDAEAEASTKNILVPLETGKLQGTPPLEQGPRLAKSGLFTSSRFEAPPPLKLENYSLKPPRQLSSGQNTPVSAVSAVTIGAGSPLSVKSVFSPSRRFFARLKKSKPEQKEHTINSLSSPRSESKPSFSDLAPPMIFSREPSQVDHRHSAADSIQSVDTFGSRKNSISSAKSGGSRGLSQMSSSNSSLNLHAYLTESPTQDEVALTESESEGENEEANRTFTMDEFLDRL